jgi:hypothetical protein
MVDGTKNRSAEQWTNADLFFLTDAVACGMPFAEVAGFLNRTESEVRAQWKLVARPMPPVGGGGGRGGPPRGPTLEPHLARGQVGPHLALHPL